MTPQKCNKYGEYAYIYASNKKWFSIFEDSNTEAFTFGYFGETLRALSEITRFYKSPYSLMDFIREIYCRSNVEKNCLYSETFYDFTAKEFSLLASGMDTDNLTRDDVFRLFTYSRFESDAVMDNFINTFAYSFPIFAQKFIADANFSIPYEWREGDFFSISLTNLFYPKLLEVPLYSHHHVVIYNPDTNTVEDYIPVNDAEKKITFAMRLRKLFGADSVIYKTLRWLYRKTIKNESEKIINERHCLEAAERELRKSPTLKKYGIKIIDRGNITYPHVTTAVMAADILTRNEH